VDRYLGYGYEAAPSLQVAEMLATFEAKPIFTVPKAVRNIGANLVIIRNRAIPGDVVGV
jgi:hypothetical protein